MQTQKKNILLISYVFPPYYGIGGRRWAKHALELCRLGYKVHVICAKNPFAKTSLWYDEVKSEPNIVTHLLPSRYPGVLIRSGNSLSHKLRYRFWATLLPFVTQGSVYDRTIFWKRPMLKKAQRLIREHNINKVICTGGPFSAMYFATLLKKTDPGLCLVNDLRDPWTWGPNWGYPDLPKKRMEYEKDLERKTLEGSDVITVPNQEMRSYLKQQYPPYQDKIVVVPHFFDERELSVQVKTRSSIIRLVYYGNIYQDIGHFLEQAAKFLADNKDKFSFDIYTDKTDHLPYFEKHKASNVRTFPQENAKSLFRKFSDYDFVFIMMPDYGKDYISTKFYEIIYTQTPVILLSSKGLVGKFIEQNRLGIHADAADFEARMLELYNKRDFKFNSGFDISQYKLSEIGKQIDTILTGCKP